MRIISLITFLLFFSFAGFSQFTPGNLALLQADASANNTTCSIIEINTTAAGQSAISTYIINGTGANALRFSGSATSTGYLANSNDGTLLCFTGANNSNTASNVNTLNPRGVGTLNNAQSFNLATTYTGTSGNQTRAATSTDNSSWYIGDQGGLYTNGAVAASPSGNVRAVKSFGGSVYGFTASASSAPVFTISAASGGTFTSLPGLAIGATSRQDFYLVSSGSNGSSYDVLYVLDATSNTAGTLFKYSLVGGSWTANGSYTTTFGGFGLAAQTAGGGAYLYVSTGQGALTANSVIKLTDAAGYNSAINITTASNITLYTAAAGKIIKGIAFAPIISVSPAVSPNPSSLSFPNTGVNAFSAGQTVTLTASNLSPVAGTLSITAPNTNFQVSNDGISWNSSTTVTYSSSGSSIGNFQVRFSPQATGLQSGNVAITGGGLAAAVNVPVSGTGTNGLLIAFSPATTTALNPPYISGTINDLADPAQQQGFITDITENGIIIPAANYTLTASSGNTTVVPNANINITKSDGLATIKITPAALGYSTITLTLTKGANNTTLNINYAASVSASAFPDTHWHTGNSDASAAIALDDNYMTLCDDEKNFLYVFSRSQSGLPAKVFDFNAGNILALTDGREVDVEAAAKSIANSGRIYWLGSMSNSSTSFADRPSRNRLFAVTVTGTGSSAVFSNAGYYANLRQQLINWGDANGYGFTTSAAAGHDPKLIDGFNVEGMVFAPDNTSLYIGFRAPLVPTATRTKAVIAPVQNFETWFNNGSPAGNPTIGSPIELDLGGRGIRDMIRLSNGIYIILAGSYDGVMNPAVYRWTGNAGDAPLQLTAFNVSALNIEGVMQVNNGAQIALNKLQFISDDGDETYYGDGIAAKDLTIDNFKKFSSDIILSGGGVLPIAFEYFSASRQQNSVILKWKFTRSTDLRSFEAERSVNGRDFTSIAVVNSVTGNDEYRFIDNNVPGEKVYYRIKANLLGGQSYLSVIRVLKSQAEGGSVLIYPNPAEKKGFTIAVNKPGTKSVNVYTANGILYKTCKFTEDTKDIDTVSWPAGIYMIRIIAGDGKVTYDKVLVR